MQYEHVFHQGGVGRNKTLHGLVYSDTHAFATFTNFRRDEPNIWKAMEGKDFVVENGDISECKNLGFGTTINDVVNHRIKRMEEQARRFPDTDFHIVLGNHERYQAFIDPLTEFCKSHPKFHLHHSFVRIGDSMFVHGDWHADNDNMLITPPYKQSEKDPAWRAYLWKGLGCMAITGDAAKIVYPVEKTLNRIHERLMQECPEEMQGVKHVFFGHVHYDFDTIERHGIQFHNTGASIKLNNIFNMMTLDITPDGRTENITSSLRRAAPKQQIM
jgi:hypothetical protein